MSKIQKPISNHRQKSFSKPVTILLTGFDAFGGDKYNPSQLVVESFPDVVTSKARGRSRAVKEIYISKQVLPTAGANGWKILKKALDKTAQQAEGPVIVLMLGLAAARKNLNLERFALNFRDYSLADNDGAQRLDETIESSAPPLLRTNLTLGKLQAALTAAGYPCDISNHAGTFICNELYFRALNYSRKSTKIRAVLFVHLPLEKVFAKTARKARNNKTPEALARMLKGIIKAGRSRRIRLLQQAIVTLTETMAAANISK